MQTPIKQHSKWLCVVCVVLLTSWTGVGCQDSVGSKFGQDDPSEQTQPNNSSNSSDDTSNDASDSSNQHGSAGDDEESEETVTVTGQLGAETASEVDSENTAVVAYGADGEGSFSMISTGEVSLDASGGFELAISLKELSAPEVIIEVSEGGEAVGAVLIDVQGQIEGTLVAAKITAETTLEAMAYLEAQASGQWNEACSAAQHRALISAELAMALNASANADYESAVATIAEASTCAMNAWYNYLVEHEARTHAELEAIAETSAHIQAQTDAELHAQAEGAQNEADATHSSSVEVIAEAYAQGSITIEEQARSAHAAAEAMLIYTTELSGEVRTRLEADAEAFRATFVTKAIEAQYEVLGYAENSSELNAVVEAGVELQAAIKAASQGEGSLDAAWQAYADAVVETLSSTELAVMKSFDGSADIGATMDSLIQAFAQLSVSAELESNAHASAQAVGEFYTLVITQSEELAESALHEVEAEVHALAEIFVHLALCTK